MLKCLLYPSIWIFCFVLLSSLNMAWGQMSVEKSRDDVEYTFSYSPVVQFETELDGGGEFDVDRHFIKVGVKVPVDSKLTLGADITCDIEKWHFDRRGDVAGAAPWDDVQRIGFSIPVSYAFNKDWIGSFAATLAFAGESGAEPEESLVYGGVLFLTRPFSRDLFLGLGVGAFSGLEETSLFPFIVINWQITDKLRLTNPSQDGPMGPAGLELVYALHTDLEIGVGGAYRSDRFRLKDDNAVSGGIGENEYLATYLRLQYKVNRNMAIDLAGGMVSNGRISIEKSGGDALGNVDYDSTPLLAITLKAEF